MSTPIALELLTQEHERLLMDHYDDLGPDEMTCDGCVRATDVRVEIETLCHSRVRHGGMARCYGLKDCYTHNQPWVRGQAYCEEGRRLVTMYPNI